MRNSVWLLMPMSLWLTGCGEGPQEKRATPEPRAVNVTTVSVAAETWPSHYEATGTVRARISTPISAKLMGYVREIGRAHV